MTSAITARSKGDVSCCVIPAKSPEGPSRPWPPIGASKTPLQRVVLTCCFSGQLNTGIKSRGFASIFKRAKPAASRRRWRHQWHTFRKCLKMLPRVPNCSNTRRAVSDCTPRAYLFRLRYHTWCCEVSDSPSSKTSPRRAKTDDSDRFCTCDTL